MIWLEERLYTATRGYVWVCCVFWMLAHGCVEGIQDMRRGGDPHDRIDALEATCTQKAAP